MDWYDRAKSRMVATLECAGEDSLAERMKNDDWTALMKSSKIYSSCGSEVSNLTKYDIQTLQLGMSLIPKTIDEVKIILLKIGNSSPHIKNEIEVILNFLENQSMENTYKCSEALEKIIEEENEYASIISECVNFFCEETKLNVENESFETLSSLNVSFV